MRDLEIARVARALRRRRGWRQEDVALRAGVHRSTVSLVERGHLAGLTLSVIRRCLEALDASLDLNARWGGAELDRLLDEQHSWLQAAWKARLERWEWVVIPEASFNRYGDRGRVDLLAWHPGRQIVLVVEIKTEVVDAQALLGALDMKVRVAPFLARDLGWSATPAARVVPALIMTDRTTNRDRVGRLAPLFARFLVRGREAVSWLRSPDRRPTGLLLYSDLRPANTRRVTYLGRQRVRVRRGTPSVESDRDGPISARGGT